MMVGADIPYPNSPIQLGDVTKENVAHLKRLNSVLFPVNYSPLFYRKVLEAGQLAKLCHYNGVCVGAVCCRLDDLGRDDTLDEGQFSVYLMTLGVLAPYRNLGLGQAMIEHIINQCKLDPSIVRLYLHVQISNLVALRFYKKYGFEIIDTVPEYYKNISPPDAHLLELRFA